MALLFNNDIFLSTCILSFYLYFASKIIRYTMLLINCKTTICIIYLSLINPTQCTDSQI